MANPETPITVDQAGEIVITRDDILRRLVAMVEAIPEPESGDDSAILTALLDAQTYDDINAPWRADGMLPYLGREIIIRGARRLASDFENGLGYFLALDIVDPETGESHVALTGSTSILAQLAAVHRVNGWPIRATPVQAKRAKPGRTPAQHLDNVGPAA